MNYEITQTSHKKNPTPALGGVSHGHCPEKPDTVQGGRLLSSLFFDGPKAGLQTSQSIIPIRAERLTNFSTIAEYLGIYNKQD
jgi:hypothetical protein